MVGVGAEVIVLLSWIFNNIDITEQNTDPRVLMMTRATWALCSEIEKNVSLVHLYFFLLTPADSDWRVWLKHTPISQVNNVRPVEDTNVC